MARLSIMLNQLQQAGISFSFYSFLFLTLEIRISSRQKYNNRTTQVEQYHRDVLFELSAINTHTQNVFARH